MSENEYRELVLAAFDREFKASRLSQELVIPTAGTLKAEAIKVCSKRFDPKDETVINSFVTAEPGAVAYLRAVQNCDYQIFRPLSTFLNDRTRGTTFRNIQLLAWLIDFKPRPFNPALVIPAIASHEPESIISKSQGNVKPISGHETFTSTEVKGDKPNIQNLLEGGKEKKTGSRDGTTDKKFDRRWLIGIAALLIGGVMLWRVWPGAQNCMYWSNDRYLTTYCDVPRSDRPLVPIEQTKLQGFRKIKRTDTLTSPYALDHFWYTRVGDSLEIYSAAGTHPLYPDKKLKRVTDYVVNFCRNHSKYGKP